MRWTYVACVVAMLSTSACRPPGPGPRPDGPSVTYRIAIAGRDGPTFAQMEAAAGVVERRCKAAGFHGVAVHWVVDPGLADKEELTVMLPRDLAPRLDEVCALVELRRTFELRICAPAVEERKWRELQVQSGDIVKPPPEFSWVERRDKGPAMLVATPEQPLALALARLRKKGLAADSPEVKAAQEKLDVVVRSDVFTGADVAKSKAVRQQTQECVFFSMRDDRKSEFETFTKRHVHEALAIIIDGKVEAAPVINSALPGAGIIEGGGAAGFSAKEAEDLAAVLDAGAMPGGLVRVSPEERK